MAVVSSAMYNAQLYGIFDEVWEHASCRIWANLFLPCLLLSHCDRPSATSRHKARCTVFSVIAHNCVEAGTVCATCHAYGSVAQSVAPCVGGTVLTPPGRTEW